MLKRTLTIFWLYTAPTVVLALGLGPIKVQSYLNQTLSADIPLLFMQNVKLGEVQVHLAPEKAYQDIGLPVPKNIPGLLMTVTKNSMGKPVIHLKTNDIITDPAISFMLEVLWHNGSLYREYAILLDPPLSREEVVVKSVPVKRISYHHNAITPLITNVKTSQIIPKVPIDKEKAGVNSTNWQKTIKETPLVIPPQGYHAPQSYNSDIGAEKPKKMQSYFVHQGENVSEIAEKFHHNPDKAMKEKQIMVAIFEANPQAFTFDNINNLKKDVKLSIPDVNMIQNITNIQAEQMLIAQDQQWHEFNSRHFSDRKEQTSILTPIPTFAEHKQQSMNINDIKPLQLVSNSDDNSSSMQLPKLIQTSGLAADSVNNYVIGNQSNEKLQEEVALTKTVLNSVEQKEYLMQLQYEDIQKQNEALQQQLITRDKSLLALEEQLHSLGVKNPQSKQVVKLNSAPSNSPNSLFNNIIIWPIIFLFLGLLGIIIWLLIKLKQTQILLMTIGKHNLPKDYVNEAQTNTPQITEDPKSEPKT